MQTEGEEGKAEKFLSELRDLCVKHDVVLSVSQYDALQVWDREADEAEVISSAGIQDYTGKGGGRNIDDY